MPEALAYSSNRRATGEIILDRSEFSCEIFEYSPSAFGVRSCTNPFCLAGLPDLADQVDNADASVVALREQQGLPLPLAASARQINWRYVAAVGAHHLLALLAFVPWFYSRTGVALLIIGIYVYGAFGMNLCYHRLLTHRSFKCPLWLEHAFALLAVWCVEDTPARWVATHRLHHHRSDERPDPHSPLVNLFWSHMGWLFVENTDLGRNVAYDRYARDIIRDSFYRFIERYVVWVTLAQSVVYYGAGFLIELALGGTLMEAVQFGASIWLWGMVVRIVFVWHITWTVNSLAHAFGYQNYDTGDYSRNNFFVALITSGEGWHNNHHAEPGSACNQRQWWEIDLVYLLLRLLVLAGLAWDVQMPQRPVKRLK
jgi:stearoyl-CoA desaturase (delta-9 desaturase)